MHSNPMIEAPTPSRPRIAPRVARAPQLRMVSSGLTHRGLVRPTNQDRFFIAPLYGAGTRVNAVPGHLFAVADGIGGAAGGGTASSLAVETMAEVSVPRLRRLCQEPPLARGRMFAEMRALFHRADGRLAEEVDRRPSLAGMGTTLTVALSLGRTLYVGHAGDSRCYLLRGEALRRLTTDHTVAHEMVRRGLIQLEEVSNHPFRNVLSNFVGIGPDQLDIEVHEIELAQGDTLLLCSDGLTEMLPSPTIAAILTEAASPETACKDLIAHANELGGYDNVTAVVARVG